MAILRWSMLLEKMEQGSYTLSGQGEEASRNPTIVRRSLFSDSTENASTGQGSSEFIGQGREVPRKEMPPNGNGANDASASNIRSPTTSMEIQTNTPSNEEDQRVGKYNTTNRRRLRGMIEWNEKGRGCNKLKALTQPVFVDVNEKLQPIGKPTRSLSTLIGCLARDPRRLPLDCTDWRKIKKEKLEGVWNEVKRSYIFPEGREPHDWAIAKMTACWRGYKSELKLERVDGKTLDDAIKGKPKQIPDETWLNMVNFWKSDKGQASSEKAIENRSNLTMCHYAGTKSFACNAETGEEPDELDIWLETHEPKKGSKLDDASAITKETIVKELDALPKGTCDTKARSDIFKKVIGEDKNGYAKTFGLGVKVPRSSTKRCALEEERAKRIRSEEKVQVLQKQIDENSAQIEFLTNLVKKVIEQQGIEIEDALENDVETNGEDEAYEDELEDVL